MTFFRDAAKTKKVSHFLEMVPWWKKKEAFSNAISKQTSGKGEAVRKAQMGTLAWRQINGNVFLMNEQLKPSCDRKGAFLIFHNGSQI